MNKGATQQQVQQVQQQQQVNQSPPRGQINEVQPPLKHISRAAALAWCPVKSERGLVALGTSHNSVPSIGADFTYQQQSSKLEFARFDLSEDGTGMETIASMEVSEKFLNMSWGGAELNPQAYPYGILCAAMTEGVVNMYDPYKAIASGQQNLTMDECLIYQGREGFHTAMHNAGCVAFHPTKNNVFAAAGQNCQLIIVNIDDPTQPEVFHPAGTTRHQGEIMNVAWNQKVPGIVSSTATNGTTTVWDLKSKTTAINIADPAHRQQVSNVAWSPDVPTQLIVAYDDDRAPSIQIWDLRNAQHPYKEILPDNQGHTKVMHHYQYQLK